MDTLPSKFRASQYFYHRSYVATYYWIYMFLEQWIASTIFRNDTSRVFMASDDYAFRRRFELTDMSTSFDDVKASSLRFPFANYWPLNTAWEADDRVAANPASLVYDGIYDGNVKIKAAAVKHTIPVQFYFDREDDARLAYDTLFFYTYNEHYYSTEVSYGIGGKYITGEQSPGSTIQLPININLKGVTFNPSFKEDDWLRSNRIFIIRVEFECRSYIIFPPKQPDFSTDLDNYLGESSYDDGVVSYFPVEDVILNFVNRAWNIECYDGGKDNFPDKGDSNTLYLDSTLQKYPEEEKSEAFNIPESHRYWRWNSFSNAYEIFDPYKCDADSIRVSRKTSQDIVVVSQLYFEGLDSTSGRLIWKIDNPKSLKEIRIHLDSITKEISLDKLASEYKLSNLLPNSNYYAYFEFVGIDGTVTKLRISFTTKSSRVENANTLVGMSW